jgi:adsorption protein B
VVLLAWLITWQFPDVYRYPPLLEKDTWLWYVVLANAGFLVLRIFQRSFCVQRLYGWKQAFLAFPRMIWGNLINFFATTRAIRLYAKYLRTGKLIAWDKTQHVFPSEADLKSFHRRLGDLLLDRRIVTVQQLEMALSRQLQQPALLGEILCELGFARHEDIRAALGEESPG